MTEHAHQTKQEEKGPGHVSVGPSVPVDPPVAAVTEDNPYGNLPSDPKGFKRIETKTPEDFMKEDRLKEEKAAKEAKEKEKSHK